MNHYQSDQVKKNANWLLTLGIILVLLGTAALYFIFAATFFTIIYFGALLLTMGLFEIINSFNFKKTSTFLLHIGLGLLYIIGGGYAVIYPVISAITLTLFFAIFFIVSGIFKLFYATTKRVRHPFWLGLNGALGILLGVLIWQQWPLSGLWVLGLFIGIDAIFTGWNWIMLALAAKKELQ